MRASFNVRSLFTNIAKDMALEGIRHTMDNDLTEKMIM